MGVKREEDREGVLFVKPDYLPNSKVFVLSCVYIP
jgi:hypothetical protein